MQNFKDLIVWKKTHENALFIYNLTKSFPKEELYGITSQLRRAAVSVPTNIAEGCGKFSQKDLANFLQISLGSSHEIEYLILLVYELKFIKGISKNPVRLSLSKPSCFFLDSKTTSINSV